VPIDGPGGVLGQAVKPTFGQTHGCRSKYHVIRYRRSRPHGSSRQLD
jgi:hypothetical protein